MLWLIIFRIDRENFSSVFFSNKLGSYKIPGCRAELFSIIKFLDIISTITKQFFKEEYDQAYAFVHNLEKSSNKKVITFDKEFEDSNQIIAEINKRIALYNSGDI